MRLELDGLPVTTIDLQLDPDSVRLGFPLGFSANGRQFVNNHLMFLVLVRTTAAGLCRACGPVVGCLRVAFRLQYVTSHTWCACCACPGA